MSLLLLVHRTADIIQELLDAPNQREFLMILWELPQTGHTQIAKLATPKNHLANHIRMHTPVFDMITFDNQLSTGIQAFGHCGSPTCTMTSAFGAWVPVSYIGGGNSGYETNTDTGETRLIGSNYTPTQTYTPEQTTTRGNTMILGLAVFAVVASILFTGKLK